METCAQPSGAHTPDAQPPAEPVLWLSQGDAAERLTREGDMISRSALNRWISAHPDIPTRPMGKGQPVFVDFARLKESRRDVAAKKADAAAPAAPVQAERAPAIVDDTTRLRRLAELEAAQADARRKRVLADEAEGRTVHRDDAIAAFRAVAAVLVQAFDGRRRRMVQKIRAASDNREAEIVMRGEEAELRTLVGQELRKLISEPAADPAVAAE